MFPTGPQNPQQPPQQPPQQMSSVEDPFEMIGTAEVNEGGVYFLPGIYIASVELMTMRRTERDNHRKFIAEFIILQSNNQARPAGTKVGWVRDLDGRYPKANAGEVRGLLAATMNCAVEQVDASGSRYAVSPENPTRGRIVRVEAFNKDGSDFTKTRFFGLDDAQQAAGQQLLQSIMNQTQIAASQPQQQPQQSQQNPAQGFYNPPPMSDDGIPF